MLRKLAAGTGAAVVAAGLAAAPAAASRLPAPPDADLSGGHPSGPRACGDVSPAEQNGIDKVTTPADGSTVAPGDTVEVTLRWDEDVIDSAVLDRALDCVQIDGRPAPGLSLDARQVSNEGHLTHRYRIPARIAPRTEICDQGFVFGPPADVPQRLSSNRVCFTVAPPSASHPVRPGAGGPAVPSPAGPPGPGPGDSGPGGSGTLPPGETPATPGSPDFTEIAPPPVSAGPVPMSSPADRVGPAESDRAPAGAPGGELPPLLPLTGRQPRPLVAAGGANLVAAGLALIGGARRRRSRRNSTPSPPPA